jgi:hypothetical protein
MGNSRTVKKVFDFRLEVTRKTGGPKTEMGGWGDTGYEAGTWDRRI